MPTFLQRAWHALDIDMQNAAETPEVDERALVERAIKRDRSAFGELYNMHVSRVYRHVYYMVGNPAEAEDLTAQAFLQAWQAIERYQIRGAPFVSWLMRIAHNLGVSHLRSRRPSAELPETLVDRSREASPDEVLQREAEGDRVRKAILQLRDEHRRVIMLRFIEDLEYREVAEIVGKSVPAVRVIQHRALNALRKQMQQDDERHATANA